MTLHSQKPSITILKNGPYVVRGNVPLAEIDIQSDILARPEQYSAPRPISTQSTYSLCRCGASSTKPICDGTSHISIDFCGDETASNVDINLQSELFEGPALRLYDAKSFCSGGRFCSRAGGIWDLTKESDNPQKKAKAIEEAHNCPSGRLRVANAETGEIIEPRSDPQIYLIEDPGAFASGPIQVKGTIPIRSHTGTVYESRARMTLCRCGSSHNKPFCDGKHLQIKPI